MPEAGGRVVAVTLPDLIALATYLEQPTDKISLRRAVEGLVERHCTLSPFTGTYMLTNRAGGSACPFLGPGGRCQVYTVRPLLCRIFFHCEWVEGQLNWDLQTDSQVVDTVLKLAVAMGNLWEGHSGLLWSQPWRYDEIGVTRDA
jgi:hypothetical protein